MDLNAGKEKSLNPAFLYPSDAFSRLDETNDQVFYARDRFVSHLDSLALSTIEKLIGELVVGTLTSPRRSILVSSSDWALMRMN